VSRGHVADDERGSITLIAAVLTLGLLVVAGLVVDGGARLAAARQAAGIAQEAARAGAEQLDLAALRATGTVDVNPAAAVAAADAYLKAAGYRGQARLVGPTEIAVTVSLHRATLLLGLIGVGGYRVTQTATASLEHGISGPQP
jgi:Flp pilus assembly protein TadG